MNLTNKERLDHLRKSVLESASKQEEGIYDRIEVDLDDYMFLLELAEKAELLEKDVSFFLKRKEVNDEIMRELVGLGDHRVRQILTKIRKENP
jgi:hypothetical protein